MRRGSSSGLPSTKPLDGCDGSARPAASHLARWAGTGRKRSQANIVFGCWSGSRRAPRFIEGPIDGESFRLYIEKVLLPTLRPGDIEIMDNLGSHKGKAVRQLIRSVGAKLFFLPKYSPDLNPIEQVFAKLKHLLRKAAARSVDAVCAAIGDLLQAFTPEECANYLANSGYRT